MGGIVPRISGRSKPRFACTMTGPSSGERGARAMQMSRKRARAIPQDLETAVSSSSAKLLMTQTTKKGARMGDATTTPAAGCIRPTSAHRGHAGAASDRPSGRGQEGDGMSGARSTVSAIFLAAGPRQAPSKRHRRGLAGGGMATAAERPGDFHRAAGDPAGYLRRGTGDLAGYLRRCAGDLRKVTSGDAISGVAEMRCQPSESGDRSGDRCGVDCSDNDQARGCNAGTGK